MSSSIYKEFPLADNDDIRYAMRVGLHKALRENTIRIFRQFALDCDGEKAAQTLYVLRDAVFEFMDIIDAMAEGSEAGSKAEGSKAK